jgi:hypothetical protein
MTEPDITEPEITEPEIITPIPSDQNNDGFLELAIQETLYTPGSIYGSTNYKTIDLNFDDVDDVIIHLHTAEHNDLATASLKSLHSGSTFAAENYQDSIFNCSYFTDGFTLTYNTEELHDCDTTIAELTMSSRINTKVASFVDLDSSLFEGLTFRADSIEMYRDSYVYRSNLSIEINKGDFWELGERYIYFNILDEDQIKKAYLKIRAESYRIVFIEQGIQDI